MAKRRLILLAAAVLLSVFFMYFIGFNEDGKDYTVFSTRPAGCGLFFDTLRRLNYPVAVTYLPLGEQARTNDVYIIICPNEPFIDENMAEGMLEWVRRGGRLVLLDYEYPTVLDNLLNESSYPRFNHYYSGLGEVITGLSEDLTNKSLMEGNRYGEALCQTLMNWNGEKIWFAEYYHGYHSKQTFFGRLPLIIKLLFYQLILITAVLVWHLGKRFGKPVPYFEETEREENEYVKALARLYSKFN